MKLNTIFYALQKSKKWIKGDVGITYLTVPKGLNYEMVRGIFGPAEDWEGNSTEIYDRETDVRNYAKFATPKTYHILIANGLLEGKFCEDWSERGIIEPATYQRHLKGTAGGEVPELLPFVTNIALTHLVSPKETPVRLFSQESATDDHGKKYTHHNYALVYDKIDPALHTMDSGKRRVGDFDGRQLRVDGDSHCSDALCSDQSGRLAVMWRL